MNVVVDSFQAGHVILEVPTRVLRSISTVPKAVSRKLPREISVNGLLAADICLDASPTLAKWRAVCPSSADLESSMPILWPPELQALLPPPAAKILAKQQAKSASDWALASASFPSLERRAYLEAWLLVNSRTFYFVTPRTEHFQRDDRMVLQPVGDLFNHASWGCAVSFDAASFTFSTDREYARGDEVCISYGRHSNDFLLAEYGFIMADNAWDEVCLDDAILPRLKPAQRRLLEDAGYLGGYMLDSETVCHRTQVALRAACLPVGEWRRFVAGLEDGDTSQAKVDTLLGELLLKYDEKLRGILRDVVALKVGEEAQRGTVRRRWEQIRALVARLRPPGE